MNTCLAPFLKGRLLWFVLILFCHCSNPEATSKSIVKPIDLEFNNDPIVQLIDDFYKQDRSATGLQLLMDSLKSVLPNDHPGIGYVSYKRGIPAYNTGDLMSALGYYKDALSILLKQDSLAVGVCLKLIRNVANGYHEVKEVDSTLTYVSYGLDFARTYDDSLFDENVFLNLYRLGGINLRESGDVSGAIKLMTRGSLICREGNARHYNCAQLERELAWALTDLGDNQKAKGLLDLAERRLKDNMRQQSKDSLYLADVYTTRALIAFRELDYPALQKWANRSWQINHIKRPNESFTAHDLNNLGCAFIRMGQIEKGKAYLNQAIQLYKANGSPKQLGSPYFNLAYAEKQVGNFNAARDWLLKAESCYQGQSKHSGLEYALYKEDMINTLIEQARVGQQLYIQDSLAYSFDKLVYSYARVDSLIGLLRYAVRPEISKSRLVRLLRPFHNELLAFTHDIWHEHQDRRFLHLGLQYLTRSKAQILEERNLRNRRIADQQSGQGVLLEIDTLQIKVRQLRYMYENTPIENKGRLQKLRDEWTKIEIEISEKLDEAYSLSTTAYEGLASKPVGLALIEQLEKDQVVIDYFVGDQSIFAGIYSTQGADLIQLTTNSASVDASVEELLNNIAKQGSNAYLDNATFRAEQDQIFGQVAFKLYQELLEPVLKHKDFQQVTIIADGSLTNLPFEVLLSDKLRPSQVGNYIDYPFLLHNLTVNYEFSTSIWLNREAYVADGKQALIVAPQQKKRITLKDWDGEYLLPALGQSETEVAPLTSLMRYHKTEGGVRGRREFIQQNGIYGLIHFAGHGVVNADNTYRSFLAFAETDVDGGAEVLYLEDLEKINLRTELLVLSACQTGNGELAPGEGIISLSRAGALAGAQSVVAAQWVVNQQAKAIQFPVFYQELATGKRRDESLRKSKLYLIQDAAYALPYYWAGFTNTGSGAALAGDYWR